MVSESKERESTGRVASMSINVLVRVGQEGVSQLVLDWVDKDRRWATDILAKTGGSVAEEFLQNVMMEAISVGIRLGYGLGTTEPRVSDDLESWLKAAIAKAGLNGYRCRITLDRAA